MILITGGTGFVGQALLKRLIAEGQQCKVSSRRTICKLPERFQFIQIDGISAETNWGAALHDVDLVVHCAARVHVMHECTCHGFVPDPFEVYRQVNVHGSLNLARQAAKAGVLRFVFISSIKVNGETTQPGNPFTADDIPSPVDPYGLSKLEAEQGLRKIEAQTGMEVVIIRPPLVYGPGVKANFASMLRWVARGVPLPLGAIQNARSMVALDNLVDLVVTCLNEPAAARQTFLVSDGEDVSTTELLHRTAQAMGKKALLLPVHPFLLEWGATMLGKRDVAQRLLGSLQVDMTKTRRQLDWTPPLSLDQGLEKAVENMKS